MDGTTVFLIGLIVGCYGLLLAHWYAVTKNNKALYDLVINNMQQTTAQLGQMYSLVNAHLQQTGIHVDKASMISRDVCHEVRRAYEESIRRVEAKIDGQTPLLQQISERLTRLESGKKEG